MFQARPARAQVALKRIPDVLSSPDLTRKVLREVCILRRLSHPFIISLRDAFLRPSSTGALQQKGLGSWSRGDAPHPSAP